jgi:hypothetical protein
LRALVWTLIVWSVWVQPPTVVACTIVEGAGLDSVRLFSVGTATHCGGEQNCLGHCSGLCSLGWLRVSQPLCWRERQLRELIWHLFDRSAWAQPATVVAGRQVRALQWTLLSWSAWSQTATVSAGTTCQGDALAAVRSVGVGLASHLVGWHYR